jgi:SAM-dependent methyltransferase
MASIESRYLDGSYLAKNPEWDRADAAWKAGHVSTILQANDLSPRSICDIGCGSGDVLAHLGRDFPQAALTGFDISPQLTPFWRNHPGIRFKCIDFHAFNTERFDVLTMLDVFEHVRDPFTFLESSRPHAKHFVFHIPLDLSALGVARSAPLMHARHSVGHLHFYTRELALQTLADCGYSVVDWRYTHAAETLPTHQTWKTHLANLPRRMLRAVSVDVSARILGGETLMVLAH